MNLRKTFHRIVISLIRHTVPRNFWLQLAVAIMSGTSSGYLLQEALVNGWNVWYQLFVPFFAVIATVNIFVILVEIYLSTLEGWQSPYDVRIDRRGGR